MKKAAAFIMAVALCVALFTLISNVAGNGEMPVFAAGSIGSSNPANSRKNEFVIVCNPYEGRLNPLWPQGEVDSAITRLIFDPLVDTAADGSPVPCLADYEVSADGLTYTFTIKKNAVFSDKTHVTTEDIAFTWNVIRDISYDGICDLSDIVSVNIVDARTIKVTLKAPRASAVFDLGVPPLSKAYYGQSYTEGQLDYVRLQLSRPLGCGQYSVGTYGMDSMTLARCENYYIGKPKYETVTFKVSGDGAALMQSGAADVDLTGAAAAATHIENRTFFSDSIGILGFNASDSALADPVVRRAISMCIDRQALIDTGLSGLGLPLDIPVTLASWITGGDLVNPFDPAGAHNLLTDAGHGNLTLTYVETMGNPASAALGELLKESFDLAGITLKIEKLDYGSLLKRVELGRCQLWFMGWGTSLNPSPKDLIATDGAYNLFGYSNNIADKLLAEMELGTAAERKNVGDRLWQELAINPPFAVLYQGQRQIAVNVRAAALVFSPLRQFTADIYSLT